MRKAHAKTKNKRAAKLSASAAVLSVLCLCSPARAQYAGFDWLNPANSTLEESINLVTPSGHMCRFTSPSGPELSVGGGTVPVPSSIGPTNEAIVGVMITFPLGSSGASCDGILEVEEARIRLQAAMEMFEIGLITQEQLMIVAEESYEVLVTSDR